MADPAAVTAPGETGSRKLRLGLLDLYLIRATAGPFALVFFAACTAMMLERALRLIHEMAASGASLSYFFPLLIQLAPYYVDLALPVAFMVALALLVARLDDHLELEAMLAAGLSLARIAAPLAMFGLLVGAASLATGGWLEPIGRYGFRATRIEAVNAGRLERLQPGALYHPSDSLALTFDRRQAGGDEIGGVFVWQQLADGRELVLTARSGRIGFAPQDRAFGVDLGEGRYVAQRPGGTARRFYLVQFDSLAFRESLRLQDPSWRRGWDQTELTLSELGGSAAIQRDIPRHALAAEYYSRIARAAIIPLLPFLVLPLAFATKKGRRGLGLLLCWVLLAGFHHGMNFAKQLATAGGADPLTAVLGVAGGGAGLILLLFWTGRHLPSHSPATSLLKAAGRGLERLRPTGASLSSLSGRTMTRYFASRIAGWTLTGLFAIVAVLQMVDIFERGDEFVQRGFGGAEIGYYALLRLPAMVQQALPIAALAGLLVAFAAFARSHELTAIRAAGISQWRVLRMALPVPLLLSLMALLLAEYGTPRSQLAFAAWWNGSEPHREAPAPEARWFRAGGEIVRAKSGSADGSRLTAVEIFRRDRDGLIVERVSAGSAIAAAAGWTLIDVARTTYGSGPAEPMRTARLAWPTRIDPTDVATFFASSRAFSYSAAQRALSETAPVSQGPTLFATRLHRSAAEPLAPLVMLLLALPLAFVAPRTGRAWPPLLYAAGGGLAYLVADGVLTVFAQVGYVPAVVGAWLVPALVSLTAVTVLLYTER